MEHTPTSPFTLQQAPRGAALRGELESFVAHAFQDKHGAQIHSFMPDLLGMHKGAQDGPQGVVDHFALKADDLPAFEQRLKARRPACHALFNRPAGPCVWRQHPRS